MWLELPRQSISSGTIGKRQAKRIGLGSAFTQRSAGVVGSPGFLPITIREGCGVSLCRSIDLYLAGQRLKRFSSLCTPYLGPAQSSDKWIPDDVFVKKLPNFGYQLTFACEEGEDLLSKNVLQGFRFTVERD